MPTTNVESIKLSRIPCGFCSTGGRHDLCPGGVLNGDRKTLVLCACTEHPQVIRCLECGHTGSDVSDITWHCEDPDACDGRKQKWAMDNIRTLYGDPDSPEGARTRPKSQQVKEKAPRAPRGGVCLHCQEPTKGGLFLPGHDAKYLAQTVQMIRDGAATLDKQLELWASRGISEALQAKLTKRVES